MPLSIVNLLPEGPLPYRPMWERQKEMVLARQRNEIPDTLLLLQHAPTVTYGKTTNPANLLLPPEEYAKQGIELIQTDRGGDATYHGPGQLVGYPLLHLGENRRDLHRYVRLLEEVVIQTAARLGVAGAGRADWHAGVWVGDGYLAALGVRVSRWVTHHGFALNVTQEVQAGFWSIVPCGVAGKQVVSVASLAGRDVSVESAAEAVSAVFPALWTQENG